jgi:selenocysteine lyase/cysteine desulfurase
VGSIPDARRIVDAAHRAGALAWADGVHLAPHRRPDRAAIGADVLLCSPYKLFGPHLGIASIRRDLAEGWPADRVRPAAQDPPGHRFETGTPSFESLAGLVAAVDYVRDLGDGDLDAAYAAIREREEALTLRALEGFTAIGRVTLLGIADPARVGERTPTFSVTVDGRSPREVAETLARDGIHVWDGDFYAYALFRSLGLAERGGAVRAGFLHYTTEEEVDRLLEGLARL